ncbi:MAG: 4'-phosphopantetheinyl transferase superfamily protein [Sulfuricaulis sp.]|nr:4'-phosphopantetheinyl transferase superfamily protein [Sulfuricaulis sp.]
MGCPTVGDVHPTSATAAVPTRQVPYSSVNERDVHRNNPAGLSPLLAGLFPPGVVGAELRIAGDPSLLFPEEAQYLGGAVPKRIQEFAAGRLCARRALAEFGFTGYPLRMNRDRRPQWPAPVIGSISHTAGMCGAVVARQRQFRAIGLDMEIVGRVTPEIWPTICTPEETAWLAALREPEQSRCAALIFSAKESFYKCQYSVTQQWLEFDDVTLDLPASDASAGCFALRPRRRIALWEHVTMPLMGRFEFHGSLIVTGMVLDAR